MSSLIKDIHKEDECFDLGHMYAPMFDEEIDVWIENEASHELAEKVAEHFANLS